MDYGDFVGIGLGSCNRTVHVKVSRLWEYRGGFHHGPVKLVHMILSDSKGNALSALVPTDVVSTYLGLLVEGQAYTLARFFVSPSRRILDMVDAPFMVIFRQATMVCPFHVSDDIFPKWIYILTTIDELPTPNDTPTCLIDVVGVVTGVSPFLSYNIPRVIGSIRKRHVALSDCSGHDITLTLWGEAADRFDGDDVYSQGQMTMVVVVFVGTTVHAYGDSKQLAGGSSCKWYIDEDIPEINIL